MDLEAIRSAVVGYVHPRFTDQYPNLPIAYNNDPFDWNSPPSRFIQFEIQFLNGRQVGMAFAPKTRVRGVVYVTAFSRAGIGVTDALTALSFFSTLLGYKYIDPVEFQMPDPSGSETIHGSATVKGFHTEQLKVSFRSKPL